MTHTNCSIVSVRWIGRLLQFNDAPILRGTTSSIADPAITFVRWSTRTGK